MSGSIEEDNTTTESTSRDSSKVNSRDELLSLVEGNPNSSFSKPQIDEVTKLERRFLTSLKTDELRKSDGCKKRTSFRNLRSATGKFGSKWSLSSSGSSAQELAMLGKKSQDDEDDEDEDNPVTKRHRSGSSVNPDKFFGENTQDCDDKLSQSDFEFCDGVNIED